ncbi:IS200/IS605 family accessory protein TnpB-related protein [Vibrio breoganii]|uniref:IS200/IS605 family accessory protein TnpB-related protein n=1 Tax=Vibrio breoganii TaxID=553239 RepID=UPI0012FFE331|nr:IS200/IS605 family accessory protein TnpB-related protein [Vibrio breoganii]
MKKIKHQVLTTQAKLTLNEQQTAALDAYAELFCRSKRRYTALMQRGELVGLKRSQIRNLVCGSDMAYRQFKGVESAVSGMIESRKSNSKNYITNIESKIENRTKRLKKNLNRLLSPRPTDDVNKLAFDFYQQQRGIDVLHGRLSKLKSGDMSFCFGGKTLLRERNELESPTEIAQWKKRWHDARHDEFVLVGSSDESWGNMNCQVIPQDDGSLTAHLTMPPKLEQIFGKHQKFTVPLRYYYDDVLGALAGRKTPLTYRFKRKDGAWYVYISFRLDAPDVITWRSNGALGVDVNADHLAVTLTTGDGNYHGSWTMPLALRGKTTAQRNDIIGNAVKKCTEIALENGVPVVIEDLDFTKKKRALDKTFPEQARMLSALAYGKIKQCFISRCARFGIELIKVNPAYTSQLGEYKYQDRYGLSRHHAAAMVIARRGLGFKESSPSKVFQFNNGSVRLHCAQDLMRIGKDKFGKTIIDAKNRAMKARDGYVLDTDNVVLVLAENTISVKRLSFMLNRHDQGCGRNQYLPLLTKLRIEQELCDQV